MMDPVTAICTRLWESGLLGRPLSRRLYRHLARRDAAIEHRFEVDFFGFRYRGDLRNRIDNHVYFLGAFEKHVLFFLRDLARAIGEQAVYVDVGANIGQHALFLSRHVAAVQAFEPYAPVRAQLEQKLGDNAVRNVRVHPVGLGEEALRLPFYAPDESNLGAGTFVAGFHAGNRPAGELEVVIGDRYLERLGLERLDLLKIDVEGFERSVLRGLAGTLTRHRPHVVLELTKGRPDAFASAEELLALLPPGYVLMRFDAAAGIRRKERHLKRSGDYRLVPFSYEDTPDQVDVVAVPEEQLERTPRRWSGG